MCPAWSTEFEQSCLASTVVATEVRITDAVGMVLCTYSCLKGTSLLGFKLCLEQVK